MSWTRYSAWTRLLFFPGLGLFFACAVAPTPHGWLSWARSLGWLLGIVIILSGLPTMVKQLVRYEASIDSASVAMLGGQGLATGLAGIVLVLVGVLTAASGAEAGSLRPWIEVAMGGILLMFGLMVAVVWRARRNQVGARPEA